ncbi:hypothetical protein [Amycolatopsis sp. cmx-4-61]|uniref:hypothetical protein n=1 Tax=Amycolatopsis sp. cmx-4-61 TaxID=2790937 RepID=UPI00397C4851
MDALDVGAAVVVLGVLVLVAGAEGAGRGDDGTSAEHAPRVRASAAPAAAVRHIRSAWQKRPPAGDHPFQ